MILKVEEELKYQEMIKSTSAASEQHVMLSDSLVTGTFVEELFEEQISERSDSELFILVESGTRNSNKTYYKLNKLWYLNAATLEAVPATKAVSYEERVLIAPSVEMQMMEFEMPKQEQLELPTTTTAAIIDTIITEPPITFTEIKITELQVPTPPQSIEGMISIHIYS